MIVWITHVKVGHRQTPYKVKRPASYDGAFYFGRFVIYGFVFDAVGRRITCNRVIPEAYRHGRHGAHVHKL